MAKFGMKEASQAAGIAGTAYAIGKDVFGIGDRQQVKQQKKLTDISTNASKELADYNTIKQKELWDQTNYGEQVKHMKKAGLSAEAILSSGGGGQGQTGAGAPSAGMGIASDSASRQGASTESAMALIQQEAMKSQIELNKAQAGKLNVETKNIDEGGIDYINKFWEAQGAEKQVDYIVANTNNKKVETDLIELRKEHQEIENRIKTATEGDVIKTATEGVNNLIASTKAFEANAGQAIANTKTMDALRKSQVEELNKKIANIGADTILKQISGKGIEANIKLTEQQTRQVNEVVYQLVKENLESAATGYSQKEMQRELEQKLNEIFTDGMIEASAIGGIAGQTLGVMDGWFKERRDMRKGTTTTTTKKGDTVTKKKWVKRF